MDDFVRENENPPEPALSSGIDATTVITPDPTIGKRARRDISRLGLALTAYIVLPQILALILTRLVPLVFPTWVESEWFFWGLQIFAMYIVGLPIFLLLAPSHPLPLPKREPVRFSFWWFLSFFCILVFCGVAGSFISQILSGIASLFLDAPPEDTTSAIISASSPIWLFLVVVVIGPIVEEIIFRHAVLRVLLPFGERGAILLSGLIFGLFHGNIFQLFYATAIGILFAYLYAKTGRLWQSILFHMLFNFFGGFLPAVLTQALPLDEMVEGLTPEMLLPYLGSFFLLVLYELVYFGMAIAGLVLLIVRCRRARLSPAAYPLTRPERERAYFLNVGMLIFFAVSLVFLILSLA